MQFILRRTGPTSSEESDLDRPPSLPKLLDPEPPKKKDPKKAHSFNLGPSTSFQPSVKQPKRVPRDSTEQRTPSGQTGSAYAHAGPSKEEIFRHILQQQSRLHDLHHNLNSLDSDVWALEQPPPPALSPDLLEEMDYLGETFRCNEAELAHLDYWESEYHAEVQREQSMVRQLRELHVAIDEHSRRIHETETQCGRLERDIQVQAENRNGIRNAQVNMEDSVGKLRVQLDVAQHHGSELGSTLEGANKALKVADDLLQVLNIFIWISRQSN